MASCVFGATGPCLCQMTKQLACLEPFVQLVITWQWVMETVRLAAPATVFRLHEKSSPFDVDNSSIAG
jgi:hypothetical protein